MDGESYVDTDADGVADRRAAAAHGILSNPL
jgi:hypothetical protein